MENNYERSFHALILLLLKLSFEEVSQEVSSFNQRADFVIHHKGKRAFVETKVFRTRRISLEVLLKKMQQISRLSESQEEMFCFLIVSSLVPSKIRKEIRNRYGVTIWDRSILYFLTIESPELREKLERILCEIASETAEDISLGVERIGRFDIDSIWSTAVKAGPIINTEGQGICTQLRRTSSGRDDASQFEQFAEKAMMYIFRNDLVSFQRQHRTSNSLHRFDLIARIGSIHDFWRVMSQDFHSRYVVFEFKNYTYPITQGEIYSTEKYLFTKALRSIAIIIARTGADSHAEEAMKGALREQGKLILCLDLDDVCEMLKMKDVGDDHNSFLADKVDKVLMSLER